MVRVFSFILTCILFPFLFILSIFLGICLFPELIVETYRSIVEKGDKE